MTGRIGAVRAAGEQRRSESARGQCRAVRGAVDPIRSARYNGDASRRQLGREFHRHVVAVARGCARTDDRHGCLEPTQRGDVAAHPQTQRGMRAEIIELAGPERIAPGHQRYAAHRSCRER